jgi:tetratricopeptide (TPR) repeat protein
MVMELSDEEMLAGAPSRRGDAAALVRYGIVFQALGRWAEAREPLLRATVLAPTNPDVWLQAAMDLMAVGQEDQAEQAVAALRQLRPMRESMWFAGDIGEPLQPIAQLSRALYVLVVEEDGAAAEGILTQLVDAYDEAALPRIQQIVATALIGLGREDEVIERYMKETDPALRIWVASALVTQGAKLADKGEAYKALASWQRVLEDYGDDPNLQHLVARALSNQVNEYGRRGQASEQLRALDETVRRYASTPDPALRRRAAAALALRRDILNDTGQQRAAQETVDRLFTQFRGDPDPVIAGIIADARIDRWLAGRQALPRFFIPPLRSLLRLVHRLRYRRQRGIDYTREPPSKAVTMLGRALTLAGRVVLATAIVGSVVFTIRAGSNGQTTSGLVLACGALAIAGQLGALLGQRLRGRFTAEMLALVPRRLPRTLVAAVFTLAIAWVSPALEQLGVAYTFGPPRETYRWFLGIGLPSWADISVMVVVAPIEVVLLIAVFTTVVLTPLRALLGRKNALVTALEDSFGSIKVEPDE